jgi:protein transport protein SEC31
VGGMEDGSLGFWNAARFVSGAADSLIELKTGAHQGAVRGLQVNPLTANLLASGSINADILLWDLGSLQSYPPTGTKSNRLEDVTDLAWNCQVSHILATGSSNGYTVIWDLKARKEVIQLALPGGRRSVSAIAWNPETPTHILTATDDDQSPVIYSWDLRNSHAPNMVLAAGVCLCGCTHRLSRRPFPATPRACCPCRGARRTASCCSPRARTTACCAGTRRTGSW